VKNHDRKFYLGYIYPFSGPEVGLHCTHMYFGTLTLEKLNLVKKRVNAFFREAGGHVTMKRPIFDTPSQWGDPKRWQRVLLARNAEVFHPMKPLRDFFGEMNMISTRYPFQPHVTTGELIIDHKFSCYALVRSGHIEQAWNITVTG
jgi:hypothetical protein